MRIVSAAASVALAIAASACVSLLPSPPPAPMVYSLRADETLAPAPPTPGAPTLSVAAPGAPRSASGADIVWRQNGVIGVMERAAWDGAAPDLLQAMLVETLGQRGLVRAAVRSGGGVRTDMEVRWDVLAFEIVEDGARLDAVMAATVTLVDQRSRAIVATRRFDRSLPVPARSGRRAAMTLETVARQTVTDIADWAAAQRVEPAAPSTPGVRR